MKTITLILITALLATIHSGLIAQSVDINTAKVIAEHHLSGIQKVSLKSGHNGKGFHSPSVMVVRENKDTLFFIVNDTINESFVIVSADKRAWPILAYSTDSHFNAKQQNEAFTAWMDNKKKEIESIKANNLQPDKAIIASWTRLSSNNSMNETNSVEPLLQTKWGQGCYYNELCPADPASGLCGHTPTGCVATAMAQIMKFWNYPNKGKHSNSYPNGIYGTLSADFEATTYEWSKMPNILNDSNNAVATLMFHCGVATFMNYGINVSLTNLSPYALIDYFDYSSQSKHINKKDYSSEAWADVLKSELDLGHPIYYTTVLPSNASHAFVCDGYQGTDFFHFNWGWDGACDGYFYLNSLNPDLEIFEGAQTAIIKITPNHLPDGYEGIILSTNTLSLNPGDNVTSPVSVTVNSSASWTAISDQEWLRLNTGSGASGTTILNLSATENFLDADRTAIVTLTADGFPSQQITVKQIHRYKVTAGGLADLMGDNLAKTTYLCLKGSIDARDFKTMRDLMPALESIDLSQATIVAYTGYNGPSRNRSIYPENTIPENAFAFGLNKENTRLTSIILPLTATSIGTCAFNACMSLTDISLPPSLQSIGENVFNNCISLDSIFLPSSVSSFGNQILGRIVVMVDPANPNYVCLDGVLYNKKQTVLIHCPTKRKGAFNIPETVTTIGNSAFHNCTRITSFTIPPLVSNIEPLAFAACIAVTSISIPSSVREIGTGAFLDCQSLTSLTVGGSIPVDLKLSDDVFTIINKDKCILYVPYKTEALYRSAYQWDNFKNIVEATNGFSLGTTQVKLKSLANSSAMVPVKSNVTWSATSDQAWLSVNPASGNGDSTLTLTAQEKTSEGIRTAIVTLSAEGFESQYVTVVQDGNAIKVTPGNLAALFNAEELRTLTSLKLTGTIDARDFKAMRDLMPMLSSVDLSGVNIMAYSGTDGPSVRDSINYAAKTIPEFAFAFDYSWGKTNLKSFIFPSSVTAIGDYAFSNCLGLDSVSLPVSLRNIGSCAFVACKNLTSIFIPSSVTKIMDLAFAYNPFEILVDPANPNYSSLDGILYNKNKTTLIQCPTSKTGNFIIPETVAIIGRNAFTNCKDITSISIPSSVNQIQFCAFAACTGLSIIKVGMRVPVPFFENDLVFKFINPACNLYVPYGTAELYQAATLWKDFASIVEMPGFTINSSEVKVAATPESATNVSITGNVTWTIVSNQAWLTVDASSGTGNQTLTLTAQENTSPIQRTAFVTVSASDVDPQTITVTQAANTTTIKDELQTDPLLMIYPNPTNGKFRLVFDQIPVGGIHITITDLTGRNCLKQKVLEKQVWLDLRGNPPGIYLIKTDQQNSNTMKVILK